MPAKMSAARQFYESIASRSDADAVAAIRKLYDPAEPQAETDWLEFKTLPDRDNEDKKLFSLWSEELCGMLNNMGGVILWGIDARENEDKICAAVGERLVKNPKRIESRLTELQRNAVEPAATGVVIKAYETASGEGFVICYIPEGIFKPYRTEDKRKQYFLRAGDRTAVMSAPVLRTMFYPQIQAVFRVIGHLSRQATMDGRWRLAITLRIHNNGTATAKNVVVTADFPMPPETVDMDTRWMRYANELEFHDPINPRRGARVGEFGWIYPKTRQSPWQDEVGEIDVTVYCENQQPQRFTTRFGKGDVVAGGYLKFQQSDRDLADEID